MPYVDPNNPTPYGDIGHDMPKKPLNVPKLISAGALRITYPGDGKGGYDPTDAVHDYSIVSKINDESDGMTRQWPNKPMSYDYAAQSINKNLSQLPNGKYQQIIDSARQLKLSDEDIYQQPENYLSRLANMLRGQ